MRNSAAFLDYQLRTALLRGDWMIDREWADSQLPLVVQLIEGKAQWPQQMQTRQPVPVAGSDAAGDYVFGSVEQLGQVRVIDISGAMTKYGGFCSYGTLDYIRMVREAYEDDSTEAVVIRVDSPGGEVSSIMELHDIVKNDAKPVVTWVEDMMASAAVMALSGSDYVMASQPISYVGSIGVYTRWLDMTERLKAMGVEMKELYSRLSTEKNLESRELGAGNMEPMLDRIDGLAQAFIDSVRADRGEKLDLTKGDPFKGKTYFAREAVEIGLIDAIGPFDVAVQKAQDLARERKAGVMNVYFNSNSQINNNTMFGDKHPKLTALRGVAPEAVTDEQVAAVNATLAELGIAGVQVVNARWVADAEQLETQLGTANATIGTLTGERDAANSKLTTATGEATTLKGQVTQLTADVATLTTERDTATAEVARLGKQPGAAPAAPGKAGQEATEDVSGEANANPFYSEADAQLAELKAKSGLK